MNDHAQAEVEKQLFLAIQNNDAPQVQTLVQGNPALFQALSPMGVSPVLFATYYQKHDIARLLIDLGAPLDLFEAAASGQVNRVRELLDADPPQVNLSSPDGFSALGLAAFFGREEVSELLLSRGADVNAISQNNMRVAPLHSAVAGNHIHLSKILIQAGADVNAVQRDGFTPLMGAAQNGNAELVQYLLDNGAHRHASTNDERTALSLAQEEGHQVVVELLQEDGGA